MTPATLLVADGQASDALARALGDAYNIALSRGEEPRLAQAAPARLTDELASAAGAAPRAVSIARARYEPAEKVAGEPEAEGTIAPEPEVGDGWIEPEPSAILDEERDPARPPRGKWRTTDGTKPEPPPVRIDDERKTLDVSAYYAAIVEQCLDSIAAAARDRSRDPLSLRDDAERRILAATDAILATGGDVVTTILAWWRRSLGAPHAFATWAAVFALAGIEGADALAAVRAGLEGIDPGASAHAELAAEALSVAAHPDRAVLGRDLLRAAHPIARAVGVDTCARAADLPIEQLRRHLFDANLPVMLSALRAAGRLTDEAGAPLAKLLERWLGFPDPAIAWATSVTLLGWGNAAPYEEIRRGGRLSTTLGARAVEILVMRGGRDDLALFEQLVRRSAVGPRTLGALARFGHPGAWSFLARQLANEDLADAAEEALTLLFGPCVEPEQAASVAAWRDAIAGLRLDPKVRYRRASPWRPGLLAAACASGDLSRLAIEPDLEELRARRVLLHPIDLCPWTPSVSPQLDALRASMAKEDARWPAAGWA